MGRILEGRNRATPSEAASHVDQYCKVVDQKNAEKMRLLGEIAKSNKKFDKELKSILDDAKKMGVDKGIVKAIAKQRELEAKARQLLEELEREDQAFLKDIRTALGDFKDLPLGAAAVDREEAQDETTAAVIGAVQADMTDEERAAADEREWDEAEPA